MAIIAVLAIHGGFSYATLPPGRWIPDPFFRIYSANIHSGRHGSSTDTYDPEGRFRPQQFADLFSKYGQKLNDGKWGITLAQTVRAVRGQRSTMDFFGVFAGLFECKRRNASVHYGAS